MTPRTASPARGAAVAHGAAPAGETPGVERSVERRAHELWSARARLTPAERAETESLPEPYRSTFAAGRLVRCGERLKALELAARTVAAHPEPSRWSASLLRIQGTVYAELHLNQQATAVNLEAQRIAREIGDDDTLAAALQDLALYPYQTPVRADELLTQAREIAERLGSAALLAVIDFNRAVNHADGDLDEVLEALAAVETRAHVEWPELAVEARADRVHLLTENGRGAQARELVESLPAEGAVEDLDAAVAVAVARAWVLADTGRVDEAVDTIDRAQELASEQVRVRLLATKSAVLGHAGRYAAAWRASSELVERTQEGLDVIGSQQAKALGVWFAQRSGDGLAPQTLERSSMTVLRAELDEARAEILRLKGR